MEVQVAAFEWQLEKYLISSWALKCAQQVPYRKTKALLSMKSASDAATGFTGFTHQLNYYATGD